MTRLEINFHGASFTVGVITAVVVTGDVPAWALTAVPLLLTSIPGLVWKWKNDGKGWRRGE